MSKRVQITNFEKTLTKQSFRDECNINNIMAKFAVTGVLPETDETRGYYGDVSSLQDYQTSLNQVLKTQEVFSNLPSKIRTRFDNDPAQFVDFVSNPNNVSEMEALGLLKVEYDMPNVAPAKDLIKEIDPV